MTGKGAKANFLHDFPEITCLEVNLFEGFRRTSRQIFLNRTRDKLAVIEQGHYGEGF